MKKEDLLVAVRSKKGFVRIIADEVAQDDIKTDENLNKRYLTVEHRNTNGTAGITYVFYMHKVDTDDAYFYNHEPENLDANEETVEIKRLRRLEEFLAGKYAAYFIGRYDLKNFWAEADVYTSDVNNKLTKKSVIVAKRGTNPIADQDVI